jgi:hypothetical protein
MKYACDDESAEAGSESGTEASGTEDEDSLRPLSLTKEEVLFIDNMLSLMIVASEGQDPFGTQVTTMRRLTPRTGLPAPLEIVEEIAYAVLFTTDPDNNGKEAIVHLDRSDLLMLREISCSNSLYGRKPVGYTLKRKIYEVLYGETYHRDKVAHQLLSQIDPSALVLDDHELLQGDPSQPKGNRNSSR